MMERLDTNKDGNLSADEARASGEAACEPSWSSPCVSAAPARTDAASIAIASGSWRAICRR